ncbi:bL17 family ribosomal protein [Aeoliella mucimassa]|uniref:Large ribosomal subunit protein bL17 n=1 Tax=Aeoliella mucimassa TaxID=2527972 RepID=A0A518AUJ1_9BACT|nr:L17 family ribosomal protein [Aeoliella mucimassa]QDU58390.1 50S ribosomal protein L17 [Aeoliella mucimassa]
MRHRRQGRKLGRNPKHQRALLRSLACELIFTERSKEHVLFDKSLDPNAPNPPAVAGRITTTVPKAKEVRPFIERCITIAKKAQAPMEAAAALETSADYRSSEWQTWRKSDKHNEWQSAIAPVVAARRRLIQLLGNREAANLLIEEIAPRFVDRDGGYTRIIQLAKPRLGDAGAQAIIEFVGKNDRVVQKAERPTFDEGEEAEETAPAPAAEEVAETESETEEEKS